MQVFYTTVFCTSVLDCNYSTERTCCSNILQNQLRAFVCVCLTDVQTLRAHNLYVRFCIYDRRFLTGPLFPIGIEHLIYMKFFCYGSSYGFLKKDLNY